MKDLEKRLFEELDSLVPDMSEKLKSYPITKKSQIKPKRNYFRYLALSLATLFVVMLVVVIVGLNPQTNKSNNCYVIDVNPSIIVVTDHKDKVTSIKSANKDADMILLGLDLNSLVGMSVEEVGVVIADEFVKLGYFTKNNELSISTLNITDEVSSLENSLIEYFCNKGYYVKVSSSQLDMEKYNNEHNTQISSIEEFEDYVENLDVYEYIVEGELEKDIKEIYKEEYLENELVKLIEKEYDKTVRMQEVLTGIYTEYYNILTDSEIDFLIKDYWYLMEKYDSLDSKTKEKLDNMTALIKEYKGLTQTEISGVQDLLEFDSIIETFIERKNLLIDLTSQVALNLKNEALNELSALLEESIPEINFEIYFDLPKTKEDLEEKVKSIYLLTRDALINEYNQMYEEVKKPITPEEYQEFLNNFNKNK